jgi:hypothetical protein
MHHVRVAVLHETLIVHIAEAIRLMLLTAPFDRTELRRLKISFTQYHIGVAVLHEMRIVHLAEALRQMLLPAPFD